MTKATPTPNWLKLVFAVISTLFCGGVMAWADAIKDDTNRLVKQGDQNYTRITVLETNFKHDRLAVEKIEKQLEVIAPQQIRMEGKIDQILSIQIQQSRDIEKIEEKIR